MQKDKNHIIDVKLILDYTHFFGEESPENRLSLIKNVSKKHILYEIAGLNYRLKPKDRLKYDTSLETQIKELHYFCPIDDRLYNHYAKIASIYTKNKDEYSIIFNRVANLFAIEEILNSNELKDIDNFTMCDVNVWDSIFKYLLSVNCEVTKINKNKPQNITLENITPSSIVLNELMIEDNPVSVPYRGIKLLEFLSSHPKYGIEIETYFKNVIKIEPDKFIFNLLSLMVANNHEDKNMDFFYLTKGEDSFLEYLSSNKIENNNPITLLSIKKAPFYKDSNNNGYIVLDLNFLIDKCYNFFVNDFWFDYLKPQKDDKGKDKFNFKDYRGAFGLFFENYIAEIIKNSFQHLKYPKPLLFDDLKIQTSVGMIEVSDIYIRQNKKILVGQVKSCAIYDKEKYGGTINSLYKNNREKFFIDFGVNQVLNSILNIIKYGKSFDSNIPINKSLEFYPIIIMNEKIFQTPLMPNLFHNRFQELLSENPIGFHKIHPLILIHISDLEYLESPLISKKIKIWDVLNAHLKGIKIMFPFNKISNKYISSFILNKKINDKIVTIIKKYSKEE